MQKMILIPWFLLYLAFISCTQVTDEPGSVDEPLNPIIQVADTLKGNQGQILEIHISDYFESNVDIVSTMLNSEEPKIVIDSLGDGHFRLSQPDDLYGEFTVQAKITNSDDVTLETELIYQIDKKPGPPVLTNETLIIMPLGDSMTNDPRPRVKLWNIFNDAGYKLNFVGNQYQQSSIPEPHHEGVGGIKIEGIMDKAESLMHTHNPAYVAMMVGTNDIAWYFDETAPEIAKRWDDLISRIFDSSRAGIYILAATIPPLTSKNVGKTGMAVQDRAIMVQQYNAELRTVINERKAKGDLIILADMEAALDLDKHVSNDGVHLNGEGYTIMGTVYYNAIINALKEKG